MVDVPFPLVPELSLCLSHSKSIQIDQLSSLINSNLPTSTAAAAAATATAATTSYIASAQSAQKTLPQSTPILLCHAAISQTVQRTSLPMVPLLLHAWMLQQLPSHGCCLQCHYLALSTVKLLILQLLSSNRGMWCKFHIFSICKWHFLWSWLWCKW
jgi:hypothetical protein